MKLLPTNKQLYYLTVLFEEKHFTRASERCFISQSALSSAISELETILEVPLIDRSFRKVEFTPSGKKIVAEAYKIINETSNLFDIAKQYDKGFHGTIKLGVIPTIAPWLIPTILPKIQTTWQDLSIHLLEFKTEEILDLIDRRQIDVAIIALPWEIDNLNSFSLFDEDMVLACGKKHKLASKTIISEQDLATHKLLFLSDGHCLREHSLLACPDQQKTLDNEHSLQATTISTLMQMVMWGPAATLLPRMAVNYYKKAGEPINFIEIDNDNILRTIALVWHKDSIRNDEWIDFGKKLKKML